MNADKFASLKQFDLPVGQYAITGSGPMGIRNLREIGDLDLIVTPELCRVLATRFGITDTGVVKKIVFPGETIEAFWQDSFYTEERDKNAPTIAERISHAEIIEGLPFDSLKNVLYFKHKRGTAKDLKDVLLIQQF